MTIPAGLSALVGEWRGSYRLVRPWVTPSESDSASHARVTTVAQGRFSQLAYTWELDGAPHDGLLLFGADPETGALSAAWVDSWHQGASVMQCHGGPAGGPAVVVEGSYPAPPDPDWRWRTCLEAQGGDAFEMTMLNITPNGEETLAVRARYVRIGDGL